MDEILHRSETLVSDSIPLKIPRNNDFPCLHSGDKWISFIHSMAPNHLAGIRTPALFLFARFVENKGDPKKRNKSKGELILGKIAPNRYGSKLSTPGIAPRVLVLIHLPGQARCHFGVTLFLTKPLPFHRGPAHVPLWF